MFRLLIATALAAASASCTSDAEGLDQQSQTDSESVWAVDFVRTLPGQQDAYVRSIETNWANARHLARVRGSVRSYQAFATAPDTTRPWDVILLTEYADSAAWFSREAIFEEIFASPEYTFSPPPAPSIEMRTFLESELLLRKLITEPSK